MRQQTPSALSCTATPSRGSRQLRVDRSLELTWQFEIERRKTFLNTLSDVFPVLFNLLRQHRKFRTRFYFQFYSNSRGTRRKIERNRSGRKSVNYVSKVAAKPHRLSGRTASTCRSSLPWLVYYCYALFASLRYAVALYWRPQTWLVSIFRFFMPIQDWGGQINWISCFAACRRIFRDHPSNVPFELQN
jgi:hypothetical protein